MNVHENTTSTGSFHLKETLHNPTSSCPVIPAKAGIQNSLYHSRNSLGPRFRGDDAGVNLRLLKAKRLVPGLALVLLSIPASAELDMPIAGWRLGDPDTPFTQEVHYPAVRPGIDADTPIGAQIRGRIRARGKMPDTATLVVNGNAMPVRLDESGAFARPYSFGAGSNSVEVLSGEERSRVQFHQSANGQSVSRLRVLLSWDTNRTDLDLHVVTPSGQHAWYGSRAVQGGAIDVDVTDGYGPEIFASNAPENGLYQIYVNFYGGAGNDSLTIARLTIITNENTPHEKQQVFTVPMRFSGELILVRQFMYP